MGVLGFDGVYLRNVAPVVLLAACAAALVSTAKPGEAAFPAATGKIAFDASRGTAEGTDSGGALDTDAYYATNSDGTGRRRLVGTGWSDYDPAWPAVGTKIAFTNQIAGDSSGGVDTFLTDADGSPDWQPPLGGRDTRPGFSVAPAPSFFSEARRRRVLGGSRRCDPGSADDRFRRPFVDLIGPPNPHEHCGDRSIDYGKCDGPKTNSMSAQKPRGSTLHQSTTWEPCDRGGAAARSTSGRASAGPPSPTKARGESWAPRSTRAFVAHAKACPLPAPGLRAYCRYRRRPLSVWTFLSVQRRRVRYLSAMLLTRSGAFSDLTYSFALSLTI